MTLDADVDVLGAVIGLSGVGESVALGGWVYGFLGPIGTLVGMRRGWVALWRVEGLRRSLPEPLPRSAPTRTESAMSTRSASSRNIASFFGRGALVCMLAALCGGKPALAQTAPPERLGVMVTGLRTADSLSRAAAKMVEYDIASLNPRQIWLVSSYDVEQVVKQAGMAGKQMTESDVRELGKLLRTDVTIDVKVERASDGLELSAIRVTSPPKGQKGVVSEAFTVVRAPTMDALSKSFARQVVDLPLKSWFRPAP
ncbi:MAG: hypothetical protein V4550_21610 [Gemmatimonadota bacterium]